MPQVVKENLEVIKVPQEREDEPQSPEETAEMVKLVSQERVQQRTAEVPVDVVELVSQEQVQQSTDEVPVDLVKLVSQERVQQRTPRRSPRGIFPRSASRSEHRSSLSQCRRLRKRPCERMQQRTVDAPTPQLLEETVEVGRLVLHERVQQRTAEQVEDAPQSPAEVIEAVTSSRRSWRAV